MITWVLSLFPTGRMTPALAEFCISSATCGVFSAPEGPVAYQHLFWFYGHPVVYVMFFPFVGAVAECVSVFSGSSKRSLP